ncbi:zinc finger protein 567-like isoform X3 [Maniola jurtina]|uniref:zinc finger protein 567-like isoform X3 n=1 Tax=Maniola jurtina TaxID=191418 RepID=UPI001E687998|nr:zinc finger protein 567-like isoform X3 [Maniola jurtina]
MNSERYNMPQLRKCCVVGCDANNRTHRLFSLPKNDKLRELWLSKLIPVNIELSGLSKGQLVNKYVCQKHFDRRQFDGMGNRLAHGYPCLFTEKEILYGIPLSSLPEHDVGDHNYALQPTFSPTEVQHSEVSTQSTIINVKDYNTSDHDYYDIIYDMEGSPEASTTLEIDEMRCCVPFCKTTAEVVSKSKEISFYEFPSEAQLRAAWLRALCIEDTLLPEPAVVCSQHFLDDDMYETESGSRQIRTDAVPSPVLVCMICLDTRSKLLLMSKYNLEEAYEHLVGHPLCVRGKLKQTLCVQCAQKLMNFRTFRDESLRARSLMMDLLDKHEVITIQHVKLIHAKHQLQSDIVSAVSEPHYCDVFIGHLDADGRTEQDATEPATETQDPPAYIIRKPELFGDRNQALVGPSVLMTTIGDEEHEIDAGDELDMPSFENDTNIVEYSRKSQDSVLKPKKSLISDDINFQTTRRNDPFANKHYSQDIFNTIGNYTDPIQYICDVCQKIFQRKSSLATHIRVHTYTNTFSCNLCKYKCTDESKLVSHMRTHTGEKPFVCKLCDYKCLKKGNLVKHMRSHTGEKTFGCELCKYKCKESSGLVRHMRTHTGEKPFVCKLCNYKCLKKGNLVKHMRTHTGEKPFGCELCKYKCKASSDLVRHMRTHTGEKSFVCKMCDYKCLKKCNLVNHMRTHTGEKPFGCELCKYKCAESSNFVKHMRTHTGEKPFVCKLCDYKCSQSGSLVNHMRTHTGEKRFSCKLCDYKCTRHCNLQMHMRVHTGDMLSCDYCTYKTANKACLVVHIKRHVKLRAEIEVNADRRL